MNFMIKQLVVEVEDSLVSFIEDIEQIQEDLPEEKKIFSQLENLKERLKSDLDFLEKINQYKKIKKTRYKLRVFFILF